MEYIDLVQLTEIADIGFVLIVIVACFRALKESGVGAASGSLVPNEELKKTEAILRELLAEASAASANLDRRLQNRKRELENLLRQLDEEENNIVRASNKSPKPYSKTSLYSQPRSKTQVATNDLPNPSWVKEASLRQGREFSQSDEFLELDNLIDETVDKVSCSNHHISSSLEVPTLSSQIEKSFQTTNSSSFEEEEDLEGQLLLEQLDPVAVKVARRLIASGQEIHKVARKLDLPIAQVRVLDRIIRTQMQDSKIKDGVMMPPQSVNAF